MNLRQPLLVAAVLLCGLLLVATATATTAADGGDSIGSNETATNDTQAGVCVIGVDSPCNGEQWDGDDPNGSTTETGVGETVERTTNASGEASAGICVVGADSPCNSEQWDGDRPARADGSPAAVGRSGSVEIESGFEIPGFDLLYRLFGYFGLALS